MSDSWQILKLFGKTNWTKDFLLHWRSYEHNWKTCTYCEIVSLLSHHFNVTNFLDEILNYKLRCKQDTYVVSPHYFGCSECHIPFYLSTFSFTIPQRFAWIVTTAGVFQVNSGHFNWSVQCQSLLKNASVTLLFADSVNK